MKTTATRTLTAPALLAAVLAAQGCSATAQQPSPLGTPTASATGHPATPSTPASPSATDWLVSPASIAMPARLSFEWSYSSSGNADRDQAVEAVEDIVKAEIAGIGGTPQNPHVIDFARYTAGESLAWINATFTNYAQDQSTWTGTARFYDVTASDFQGSGTGESGIVQFCSDGSSLLDKNRTTGATTSDASSSALVTFKVTAVPGGWQASNFAAAVKDPSCGAG